MTYITTKTINYSDGTSIDMDIYLKDERYYLYHNDEEYELWIDGQNYQSMDVETYIEFCSFIMDPLVVDEKNDNDFICLN